MQRFVYAVLMLGGLALAVVVLLGLPAPNPAACGESDGFCRLQKGPLMQATAFCGVLMGVHLVAATICFWIPRRIARGPKSGSVLSDRRAAREATRSAKRTDRGSTLRAGITAPNVIKPPRPAVPAEQRQSAQLAWLQKQAHPLAAAPSPVAVPATPVATRPVATEGIFAELAHVSVRPTGPRPRSFA